MPRKSAEARAMQPLQEEEPDHLEPDDHLDAEEQKVWWKIVRSKRPGWFDAGSGVLLATYCMLVVQQRQLVADMAELEELGKAYKRRRQKLTATDLKYKAMCERANDRRLCLITNTMATLATKLRLTVQAQVSRKSSKLTERGFGDDDPLLGRGRKDN